VPSYLALNVWSSPGTFPSGVRATPDGNLSQNFVIRNDLERWELLVRWKGALAVVEESEALPASVQDVRAAAMFRDLPIRFLARNGVIVQRNVGVQVQDDWPTTFDMVRERDVGVFCAFVFERAKAGGLREEADAFRSLLHGTMPGIEMAVMYDKALEFAAHNIAGRLDARHQGELDRVRKMVRSWAGK
jgi:hypothetical protein